MNIWSILIIIGLILFCVGLYIKLQGKINNLIKYYENQLKQKSIAPTDPSLSHEILLLKQQRDSLQEEIDREISVKNQLIDARTKEIDKYTEERKQTALQLIEQEIKEWSKSAQLAAEANSALIIDNLDNQIGVHQAKLNYLLSQISDFQKRQDVINQEILRARQMEDQQDFYRIQLSDTIIHDIGMLNSIRQELTKVDYFDKFIYDVYIKKSVDEMIKRVLEGGAPSGIYKITRIKTGEIYIGKSTNIKNRWANHVKAVFHCGTISHATLHTIMEKDGVENFTWEVLEELPKDQLGEREKFWIEFYHSKEFGLNEKSGG